MNVLCLADMHGNHPRELPEHDVLVVAGDTFEYFLIDRGLNPYRILSEWTDRPIVFCLGNHEFFYRRVNTVLAYFAQHYDPAKYDVHCLDVVGSHEIDGINFLGNVLWYDGSLKCRADQMLFDWCDGRWMDKTIVDFDPIWENRKCIEQIRDNLDTALINFLVTHMVPYRELNGHSSDGELNAFSGVDNILESRIDYAVCGHTHCKVDLGCFRNVGNDYRGSLEYTIFRI